MKFALIALIGAAGALAGCTDYPPPPPPGPAPVAAVVAPAAAPLADGCFRTHDITNHQIGDDRTLFISVNHHDVYRLDMSGSCLAGATSSDPIVIREPPGVPYVCRAIDLDISIAHGVSSGMGLSMRTPCIVQSIVRLTPAEVDALPPKLRP